MALRIGVLADDFTGATDIAGFLVSAGMTTVQFTSPEDLPEHLDERVEAAVISLKTRSIAPAEAVAQSLKALAALTARGAEQIIFKYCSTFDSTAEGNIGPVTDALLEAMGEDFTVLAPALPVNGRTVYQGHLFVHDQPLDESGMRDHPVTPMTDSSLVRLMQAQAQGCAVVIPHATVEAGPAAVRQALTEARASGARYAVPDTVQMRHLETLGAALTHMPLITGGSGIGYGLARAVTRPRGSTDSSAASDWTFTSGPAVVLSGSSSQMTNAQVRSYRSRAATLALDIGSVLAGPEDYCAEVLDWVAQQQRPDALAPLVYATASPEKVRAAQQEHGAQELSAAIEDFFSRLARALREHGTRRFIVAGGETSGAVTQGLGVRGFEVGPQIAPGVPWTRTLPEANPGAASSETLDLALKSGNFGEEDFFAAAQQLVSQQPASQQPATQQPATQQPSTPDGGSA
ncbi:four-carbon acid sugar kinase family protein [Nesterenkonia sp. E16_7]|uniref:3-oxo-tetronate kinase n=1 Tax=unclassified Nesterenkonia TaxID=2629769 RepID=UPI001A9314E7|nr:MULTISPECIES: 3-oxo-tetronate kinase [unclassified Nesterenkonia]MBO0594632.1 four-carbon acid sugar kinase family protein [Nesterenkonia sp. E16_10]MBO0598085.1 four-carbon acid sugar kinase family protein [Nesterenkonia sp. E16_7]